VRPKDVLTEDVTFADVHSAYREFDRREPGWIKVALNVTAQQMKRMAA
jgi:hypothetical protein